MILKFGLYSFAFPVLPDAMLKMRCSLKTLMAVLTCFSDALTVLASFLIAHQHLSSLKLEVTRLLLQKLYCNNEAKE